MDYLSLLLPIAYLILLLGSLATFSTLYRRRQAQAAASLTPWFPPHTPRNIYLSLLELQSAPNSKDSSSPSQKIPDTILRAALLRRAVEDIHRLMALRTQKPALMQLLQRGSVGDDLYKRFQAAEKEMEVELKDVVAEANALAPLPANGNPQQAWGNTIFQSASEMAHREGVGRKLAGIERGRVGVREEWEGRRRGIGERFLGELGGDSEKGVEPVKEGGAAGVKNGSSDEDTVLVEAAGLEAEGQAESGDGGGGGGGGGKKKKKGKK